MSKDVRANLRAEVNALYDLFIRTVIKGRGLRLTAGMAKDTEARALIGKAAVAAGLADRVGTLALFRSRIEGNRPVVYVNSRETVRLLCKGYCISETSTGETRRANYWNLQARARKTTRHAMDHSPSPRLTGIASHWHLCSAG